MVMQTQCKAFVVVVVGYESESSPGVPVDNGCVSFDITGV